MDFNKSMEFINSFDKLGAPITDLNRIEALLAILGNPQNQLKYIHVAGTNGKGSVAEMCSNILIEAGYKTGLFTSPFIVEYSDRIRVNGKNIEKNQLCKMVGTIKDAVDSLEYKDCFSQFEISTAIAFLYFKSCRCDIGVMETGIGGRLDCTNVIRSPIATVITSISLDHMAVLGETVEEIAQQKAGIIKHGIPCVLSADNPAEVVSIIKNVAAQTKSKLVIPDKNLLKIYFSSMMCNKFIYKNSEYKMILGGTHQITNALSVIETMNLLAQHGFAIKYENVFSGISRTRINSRTELLSENPLVMLDGAHNQGSMEALANMIKGCGCPTKIAIVGMLKDKEYETALSEITPYISEFICVDGFHPNAVDARKLADTLEAHGKSAIAVKGLSLVNEIIKNMIPEKALLIICGSLYLTSAIRKEYFKIKLN